ncbi:hypothetical protein DFH07DRAFT_1058103, partial [Mycena maculata]
MVTNDNLPSSAPEDQKFPATQLRSRLDTITQRMVVLEAQIELLRREGEGVLAGLAAVVYLILPDEITAEIVTRYVHNPSQEEYWRPQSLLRLTDTLDLLEPLESPNRPFAEVADRLHRGILHTGGFLVDLHMKIPASREESNAILRLLDQYSARWRSLKIVSADGLISFPADIRGPFSFLTKLSLSTWHSSESESSMIPQSFNAPHLREITKLELLSQDVDECLAILACTTLCEAFGSILNILTAPSRVLRHLRTIDVDPDISPHLLDHLVLPMIDHVPFRWLAPECAVHIGHLIMRSGEDEWWDAAEGFPADEDVELALQQLRRLRPHGLELDIRSSIKWFSPNFTSDDH